MSADVDIAVDRTFWRGLARELMRRPKLWPTAIVQAGEFAPNGWWKRAPFLPIPDAKYMAFRLETQYGTTGTPEPHHVIEYLAWCREMRALTSQ